MCVGDFFPATLWQKNTSSIRHYSKCVGGSERDSGTRMTMDIYSNRTITCPSPSYFPMSENLCQMLPRPQLCRYNNTHGLADRNNDLIGYIAYYIFTPKIGEVPKCKSVTDHYYTIIEFFSNNSHPEGRGRGRNNGQLFVSSPQMCSGSTIIFCFRSDHKYQTCRVFAEYTYLYCNNNERWG